MNALTSDQRPCCQIPSQKTITAILEKLLSWSLSCNKKKSPPRSGEVTCCLPAVTGAGLSGRQMHRTQGVFNHTEDYVLLPDERTISLCCWDSRTAERKNLLSLGHNNIVRCIVHSPTNPGFMTCSDDFRARFWYRRTTTDWDLHVSTLLMFLPISSSHLNRDPIRMLDSSAEFITTFCWSVSSYIMISCETVHWSFGDRSLWNSCHVHLKW